MPQYCVGFGEKGKGKRRIKVLYPLPFNLFPKPDSELKMLNRAVLRYALYRVLGGHDPLFN
jgi:hypothetical protein